MQVDGKSKNRTYDGGHDGHRLCLFPLPRELCTPRPNQRSQPCQTMTKYKSHTSMDHSDVAAAMDLMEHCTLRFHMDLNAWDVIEKQVMDWRDSSWTSMALPGNKMCMSYSFLMDEMSQADTDPVLSLDLRVFLPLWKSKDPACTKSIDDPDLKLIAKVIAVLLLASCFALPHTTNTSNVPATWYHKDRIIDKEGKDLKLISSLRQQMQWNHAPAHGHHARSNSVVSLRPDTEHKLSREDLLAEEISRRRLSRRGERRYVKKSLFRRHDHLKPGQNEQYYSPHMYYRASTDSSLVTSFSQHVNSSLHGGLPIFLDPYNSMRWTTVAGIDSNFQQRDLGNDSIRSSNPMLRSEKFGLIPAGERTLDEDEKRMAVENPTRAGQNPERLKTKALNLEEENPVNL